MKKVKLRIKEIRIEKNITPQQIAEYLNISLKTYLNLEKGNAKLSIYVLAEISNFFNVSIDYLVGRTN